MVPGSGVLARLRSRLCHLPSRDRGLTPTSACATCGGSRIPRRRNRVPWRPSTKRRRPRRWRAGCATWRRPSRTSSVDSHWRCRRKSGARWPKHGSRSGAPPAASRPRTGDLARGQEVATMGAQPSLS